MGPLSGWGIDIIKFNDNKNQLNIVRKKKRFVWFLWDIDQSLLRVRKEFLK